MPGSSFPRLDLDHGYGRGEDNWDTDPSGGMNKNLRILNALVQAGVLDRLFQPDAEERVTMQGYIVKSPATGTWAGKDHKLAFWFIDVDAGMGAGIWVYFTPYPGFRVFNEGDGKFWYYKDDTDHWVIEPGSASALSILDEGEEQTAAAISIDFTGSGVEVTSDVDGNVTVDIGGGGGGGSLTVGSKTGDFTFSSSDETFLLCDDGSSDIVCTLPDNTSEPLDVGTQVSLARSGTGLVSFAEGAGVSFYLPADLAPTCRSPESVISALKIDTNKWQIFGDLAAD